MYESLTFENIVWFTLSFIFTIGFAIMFLFPIFNIYSKFINVENKIKNWFNKYWQKLPEQIHEFKVNLMKNEYIMTYTENIFFNALYEYLKDQEYLLFTKVRLADIFTLKPWLWKNWFWTFNKIKSKHIDFVITDTKWKILKCIELDDYRHSKKNKSKSDKVKDDLFSIFDIDLIRFDVWTYDLSKLNLELKNCIE